MPGLRPPPSRYLVVSPGRLQLPQSPVATHLLGVLAQWDAQALQPLLQLSDVHHAVPIAVQRPKERLVARGRLRVLAGGGGQHEGPQPAQHGPGKVAAGWPWPGAILVVRPGWVGRQPQSLWNVVGGEASGSQEPSSALGVAAQLLLGAELAQARLGYRDWLGQIQAPPERAGRRDGVLRTRKEGLLCPEPLEAATWCVEGQLARPQRPFGLGELENQNDSSG